MISKEDADKLKDNLTNGYGVGYLHNILDLIDELTEPAPDPMQKYVGTDRLMVFQDVEGNDVVTGWLRLITNNIYPYKPQPVLGPYYRTCKPYLSDTVYYIRQMVDKGKVIQDNTGAYMKFEDDTVWWRHGWEQKWEMADSSTNNISRIADHQWHTVDSEGE